MTLPDHRAAKLAANMARKKIRQEKDLSSRLQLLESQQHHESLDSRLNEIEMIKAELKDIESMKSQIDLVLDLKYRSPVANLIASGLGLGLGWVLFNRAHAAQLFLGNLPIILSVFVILLAGLVLYLIRLGNRILYGMAEICVGILTACKGIDFGRVDLLSQLSFLQLLGGLYIVVRGFDNITKGIEAKDEPTFWQVGFNRLMELLSRLSDESEEAA